MDKKRNASKCTRGLSQSGFENLRIFHRAAIKACGTINPCITLSDSTAGDR